MNKVLVVQTIFCPTKKMLEYQLRSLKSFSEYLDNHPFDGDIVFGGYVDGEYFDELVGCLKQYFNKKCTFYRYEKNFGKAYVVNNIISKYNLENYKFIFTFDSDICFYSEGPNVIDELINSHYELELYNNKKCGLIACNFTGDNAHWIDRFENYIKLKIGEYSWPTRPIGIAGGCIFISSDAWKDIGGYRVMGVYAPDDAALMQDIFSTGRFICVRKDILVHHPGTHDDPHYQKWKERTSQNFKKYDEAIDYCDKFWEQTKIQEEGVKKLKLPNVTLLIVDCVDLKRAINAIDISTREVEFGEIKLLTSINTDYEHAVSIDPITSKEQYSEFCIKQLNEFVDTDYVLVIQYDGFVIGGKKAWKSEFLNYDYIGAPWNYVDGMNVGNGGFSLRSKKLLRLLSEDNHISLYHPEDNRIGRMYRPYLESKGIVFAPEGLAWQFAIECGNKWGWNYKGQFGFHGFDVINYNNIKL